MNFLPILKAFQHWILFECKDFYFWNDLENGLENSKLIKILKPLTINDEL